MRWSRQQSRGRRRPFGSFVPPSPARSRRAPGGRGGRAASRVGRAALAGALAWGAGMQLFFGPAQALLADERLQSPKMDAIFMMEPAPRIVTDPWLLLLILF